MQVQNRCGIGIMENSIYVQNNKKNSMYYPKVTEGVYYQKLQVESLVQITFSKFQNSPNLHHEFIITSMQKELNYQVTFRSITLVSNFHSN
jgi:hypothetical protein